MSEIETYKVSYSFNSWYYTSADEDLYVPPITYRAVPISRDAVTISTDDTTASFTVRFPLDAEFLELFRVSPPSGLVTLLCEKRNHINGAPEEIVFKGHIIDVQWSLDHAELTCESSSQSIIRMGLRRHYMYGCPHMLYGGECRVDRNDFVTIGPASNITGNSVDLVAVSGQADDYYAGGYIEYTHSEMNTIERIAVSSSSGPTLTLFSFPVGLVGGAEVKAYAGCDRQLSTCADKFNNVLNYGGMPFIPTKDPFGGDPIF